MHHIRLYMSRLTVIINLRYSILSPFFPMNMRLITNLSFMHIKLEISKFNCWYTADEAWISTVITEIDETKNGKEFVFYSSTVLQNTRSFKNRVLNESHLNLRIFRGLFVVHAYYQSCWVNPPTLYFAPLPCFLA